MTFGQMPPANGFLEKKDFENEYFYEMEVGFSDEISLLQLNNFTPPKNIHTEKYPFYTSSSKFMENHFQNYANWMMKDYLNNNSKLIEIGSNDGTLLKNFKKTEIEFLGFEPSSKIANLANIKKINTINKFFDRQSAFELAKYKKNTDVICAANVIAHIPDLKDLISGIDELLSPKGVFIFEEPYLGSMFSQVSYDQIYDEHIYLFSLSSIKKIFNLFDFELIDALPQITHGGSIRYVIARKNKYQIKSNVLKLIDNEKANNLDNIESCLNFKKNCEISKKKIIKELQKIKNEGKKICGYAATAKSSTVLNYCKIGRDLIDYITDTTSEKIGKFSPGMHIPIVSVDEFKHNPPDVAYLFAWNHRKEIFKKEKNFSKNGGKWFSHVKLD
tara:strand:- start:2209 stop:3372 length:1164 start_codon:yes stop_codon:yes gene_type:complete